MIYSSNQTEIMGILGMSWQEKLSSLIRTQTGVSVSTGDINRMNEAYTKGRAANLSGVNLVDYIAAVSGVKNAIASTVFVSNVEKYKTMTNENPFTVASGVLTKLLLLSGVALAGYFIVKANVAKRITI